MLSFTSVLASLLFLSNFVISLPHPSPWKPSIQTIYQFPNETWIENIAVRSNGKLLVTLITTPDIYQVDPFSATEPVLVHSFSNAASVLGIAEIEPDVFGVVVGNWSTKTFATTNGSYSVWKVDLRSFKYDENRRVASNASVTEIASIPDASFLNGLTLLSPSSPYLLIADAGLGVVWRLNYRTAKYDVALDDALMKPASGDIVLGVNGLHTRNGYLYFTNNFQYLFARVPISPSGTATGPYEVLAYNGLGDDFAFDNDGNAYIAQDPGDALERVTPEGIVTVLAGNTNSTILEGDTAAAFGRTEWDRDILYVVTNGGISGPVAETNIVGGKVLRVNVPALLALQ
jgi:hypothetical protein